MRKPPTKIIDFHVHLFPDRLFQSIWNYFATVYKWDVIYQLYYRQCVEHLKERGVSPIVFSNYAHKTGMAEGLNRWNLEILDEISELYCFCAFHPGDANAMDMARRLLDHPKVLGFKLQLLVQNFYPYDERLYPLYELVIERNKRILFHVGTGPAGNEFVGYSKFVKVLERYPDLPANVAHMGCFEYQEFMDLLPDFKRLYLDTSFSFFNPTPEAQLFNLPAKRLEENRDQLVYGSDFPNLVTPREEEINNLSGLGLSDTFYSKLFFENGARLIREHSNVN